VLDGRLLALYLPFCILLVITPGPDTLNVLALSMGRGREAGLRTIAGHAVSSIIPVAGAAFGVSSLIASSVLAFNALKFVGAGYLVYLGYRQIVVKPASVQVQASISRRNDFWQGFITHLTNPKVALFYLSVLPQFVNPRLGRVWFQALELGLIQKMLAIIWLCSVAFAASKARAWLETHETFLAWQRRVTGMLFVGFGLKMALSRQK
jgi:threonine/homoserine/homoserine lactone efflux protein